MLVAALLTTTLADPAAAALDRKSRRHESEKKDRAGKIPPGQLQIVITIGTQRVAVYSDGVLAARSVVATGVPGHPTPTGIFSVIGKERYHASNIYSGAPMPFMQRITWSGVALHLGVVPGRPASHGCIRLTPEFAQTLWTTTRIGARVIIVRDEVAPVEISHPLLFEPRPAVAKAPPDSTVKTADAATVATDAKPASPAEAQAEQKPPELKGTIDAAKPAEPAPGNDADELSRFMERSEAKKELPPPTGPISVFVSRKEKRIFVRQNFLPLFDAPVTIRDGDRPLGTHSFTAMAAPQSGGDLRWLAISVPDVAKTERKMSEKNAKRDRKEKVAEETPAAPGAAEALDRIDIPRDAVDRIQELVTAGASLIVSDQGLGEETGEGTDFIVVTR